MAITADERSDIHQMRAALRSRLERMERLDDDAAIAGRDLLPAERIEYRELETDAQTLGALIRREEGRREARDNEAGNGDRAGGRSGLPDTSGEDLAAAINRAGFDLRERPAVTIPLATLRDADYGTPAEWAPERLPDIQPSDTDRRWLWMALPGRNAAGMTAIEDWRTAAATVSGNVETALGSGDAKATLEPELELVQTALKQLAVIAPDIPTAIVQNLDSFNAWLRSEATDVLNAYLDRHVIAQIAAANPATSNDGADLIAKIRNAVKAMRNAGMNPDLLALSPDDAALLDLSQDGTTELRYIFPLRATGSSSPIWNLRVIEVADQQSTGGIPPTLIDRRKFGTVYVGDLQTLANPFSKMSTNLIDVRFEMTALAHVRNSGAVHQIAPAGDGDGDA